MKINNKKERKPEELDKQKTNKITKQNVKKNNSDFRIYYPEYCK